MGKLDQLRELPVAGRIQLVEDLWDTIAADAADVVLSAAHLEELDRRLDGFEDSPEKGVAWSTPKARIQRSM